MNSLHQNAKMLERETQNIRSLVMFVGCRLLEVTTNLSPAPSFPINFQLMCTSVWHHRCRVETNCLFSYLGLEDSHECSLIQIESVKATWKHLSSELQCYHPLKCNLLQALPWDLMEAYCPPPPPPHNLSLPISFSLLETSSLCLIHFCSARLSSLSLSMWIPLDMLISHLKKFCAWHFNCSQTLFVLLLFVLWLFYTTWGL